jgi:hypothetical protein
LEATITQNYLRGDGQSRSFLTNVASSANNKRPIRRHSFLSSVQDIEAEYHKITGMVADDDVMMSDGYSTGADAASVGCHSLPARLSTNDNKYPCTATSLSNTTVLLEQQSTTDIDRDDESIASTIVSYNDAGDYMYFDANSGGLEDNSMVVEDDETTQVSESSLLSSAFRPYSSPTKSPPPKMVRASSCAVVSRPYQQQQPHHAARLCRSASIQDKIRAFEQPAQHKVDLPPMLVRAAFSTGGSVPKTNKPSKSLAMPLSSSVSRKPTTTRRHTTVGGEILVDIYQSSTTYNSHYSKRRGSETPTERSESPTDDDDCNDASNSSTAGASYASVYTIVEADDEDVSTTSGASEIVASAVASVSVHERAKRFGRQRTTSQSVHRRPQSEEQAVRPSSPSFLGRVKRLSSSSGKAPREVSHAVAVDNSNLSVHRRKSLIQRSLTRSARTSSHPPRAYGETIVV